MIVTFVHELCYSEKLEWIHFLEEPELLQSGQKMKMESFWRWTTISAKKVWPFFLEIPIIKVEASITAYKNTVYLETAKVNAFLSTCLLAFLMFSINFWLFSNYTVSKFSTDLDRKLKSVCIAAATSHNWFYGLKQIHVNFYHVPVERICSHKFTLQTL